MKRKKKRKKEEKNVIFSQRVKEKGEEIKEATKSKK